MLVDFIFDVKMMETNTGNIVDINERFIICTQSDIRMKEIFDLLKTAAKKAPVTVNITTDYIESAYQRSLMSILNTINQENKLEVVNLIIDKEDKEDKEDGEYLDSMMGYAEKHPNLIEKIKIIK